MARAVEIEPGVVPARWWHALPDGRLQCDLCPRYCRVRDAQRGFCFVRKARGGQMVLTTYGRSSGLSIDPVEKKPLYHFYPGSNVLSFGTAGCNLGCRYCQNWDISKAKDTRVLSSKASPRQVAEAAVAHDCAAVAFTYNDPIVFAEYALDCAEEVHARGLRTIAVSNGYISAAARREFFSGMDAVNIDLKAFSPEFYRKVCAAHLEPVLNTLEWLHTQTDVWLEVTTLLIPGYNDAPDEIDALCRWFAGTLGPDVPLHFSRYHPDFKMRHVPATPVETLRRAMTQAYAAGIHHVYLGNVSDAAAQSTSCPGCGRVLIARDGYAVGSPHLDGDARCSGCGRVLPGHFGPRPTPPGANAKLRPSV